MFWPAVTFTVTVEADALSPLDVPQPTGDDGPMNSKRRRKSIIQVSETADKAPVASRLVLVTMVAACTIWCWAYLLLASRVYMADTYRVVASAPPLWGFGVLGNTCLLAGLAMTVALLVLWRRSAASASEANLRPAYWLMLSLLVPLLDSLRAAGVVVPLSYAEPLFFIVITGQGIREMVRPVGVGQVEEQHGESTTWLVATWALALIAGIWFFLQSDHAYREFLLGYHDFGHFARRVVNTWEGRGFLVESPGVPAFWDHFNPGLALLAPLWGLWPDARLFFLIQAICLAIPAPIVYGIARVWGADARSAAAWGLVYLLVPSTSQLNLSFSYGWHPVSLAIPLLFLAVLALLRQRYWTTVFAVLIACSFKESIVVGVGCFAAAMALQRFLPPRGDHLQDRRLERQLRLWQWLGIWTVAVVSFFLIYKFSAFAQFQTARFVNLGDSPAQILLSPVLRPKEFWGQVASRESIHFLLILCIPLGVASLARGWRILIAAAFPVLVLCAWEHPPAKCYAFQYVSEFLAVLIVAAIAGAAGRATASNRPGMQASSQVRRCLQTGGIVALASSLVAASLLGAYPWSARTTGMVVAQTYPVQDRTTWDNPRGVGTEANSVLKRAIARVSDADSSVLATGRVASHLLGVRRLESVDQAVDRVPTLVLEDDSGRVAGYAFDWILLDLCEEFQQSRSQTQLIVERAAEAGYENCMEEQGILVLRSP